VSSPVRNTPDEDCPALTQAADYGDMEARDRLFALLYDKLHRLAQRELRVHASLTLSPTTLLHETFLNIAQRESAAHFHRSRFMVYASRAMRGIVIDYLRRRQARKRGGDFEIVSLQTDAGEAGAEDALIAQLSGALTALEKIDKRLAECVDLKFFCGFSFGEVANILEVSPRTVQRDWQKARVLLNRFINSPDDFLAD
jgi:RNA polymerase sigma factor (TIGR02999 family)